MKRIATGTLLFLSLLLMRASGFLSAQEAKPSAPAKQPAWTQIASGLWRTELGPGEPDIAVLRLSDDEYKEFFKDPKGYFNTHHVFPKNVNKAKAAGDDPPPTQSGWIVVAIHTPYSTSHYVSWPVPNGT